MSDFAWSHNYEKENARSSNIRLESADHLSYLERYSSLGPNGSSPKLNGNVNSNGLQSHPDSPSRAMVEASMPLSVATPCAGEQFPNKFALPPVYLTPTERRNVPRIVEQGESLNLENSSDSDAGVDVDQPRSRPWRDSYYDDVITRINTQLEVAVARGTSPYAIYGMEDDDADDWC